MVDFVASRAHLKQKWMDFQVVLDAVFFSIRSGLSSNCTYTADRLQFGPLPYAGLEACLLLSWSLQSPIGLCSAAWSHGSSPLA